MEDAEVSQQEQDLGKVRREWREEEDSSEQSDCESDAESADGEQPVARGAKDSDIVKFQLDSPAGGKSIEFTMVKGQANRDIQEELTMHINHIFKLSFGLREAFEKTQGADWKELPWSDAEQCPALIAKLNNITYSVLSLWRHAKRPSESEMFKSQYCTSEQLRKLSFTIFNRVVKNAHVLNKCYKSFTSQTYGETSFDQIQIILDRLQMTDKDVFLDLGSGVGHVVTYAAAYSMAKKCVGIEINRVPARMAFDMKKEFEGMMSWYGKKHQPFDLLHGNFLADKFRNLITKEATVIYMNNFAYDPTLMFAIKQMILELDSGVRIIATKSLLEEREDRVKGNRSISRQTVDMMLDVEELPLADAPVSWGTGKDVHFFLYTVNHAKIEQVREQVQGSLSGSGPISTRSGNAESVVQTPFIQDPDRAISAAIEEVQASFRVLGGGHNIRLFPDDEDSDDDEDYATPSLKWSGLKTTEKASKKDNKARQSAEADAARAAAADVAPAPFHNAPKMKVVKEEPTSPVSKPKATRAGRRSLGGGGGVVVKKEEPESPPAPSVKRRKVEEKEKRGRRATSSMATTIISSATSEPKPEDEFPFGKVAAAGHSDDFVKEEAPVWAVDPEKKIAKNYVAVFAPHHSIFEENLENLPKRRSIKVERFMAGGSGKE